MNQTSEMRDSLRLLGGFELAVDHEPIPLGQPRLEEFVAFLAVHPGEPFSRSQIAYRFWPDSTDKQARTNTRQLLFKLKQAWDEIEHVLSIDRSSVAWRMEAPVVVDTHLMRELMEQADAAVDLVAKSSLLRQAEECYQGDFLPDCFSDWALTVREQVNGDYSALLLKLVDVLVELREYGGALAAARQLIEHDPVQEVAYRRLMQVHVSLGDRAAALRAYHSCASMLQKELGVEPSPATMQMRAMLLQTDDHDAPPAESPRTVKRPRLIGRHPEWQQLKQAWGNAQQGNGQCVLIWGEAGIGKSRLAEELIDWVRHQGHVAVSSRSYAAEGALTYAPITEWLRHPSIQPIVSSVDGLWQVELARLLPELRIENNDLPAPGPLTEAWQQQRFYQSIVHVLKTVPGPLLLHLDDMQWSDHETLTLIHYLMHNTHNHPLLLVGTIRSEDAVGNEALTTLAETLRHANQLAEYVLSTLTKEETAQLAELTAGAPLSSEQNAALYENSEGHPLFLIESLRSEQATESAPVQRLSLPAGQVYRKGESAIPPRIFQLLSARLHQLSPEAQLVASSASVIGHSFTYTLLKESTDMEEASLVDVLDELWMRRIIREQEGDSYDFSHDRIREVAYQQISRTRRRMLHRTVARSLESVYAQNLDIVAGELARHFALAGDSYRAYEYYRRAANLALRQYSLTRADELFSSALNQLSGHAAERILTLGEQSTIYKIMLDFDLWNTSLDEQQAVLETIPEPTSALIMEINLSLCSFYTEKNEAEKAQEFAVTAVAKAEELDSDNGRARVYLALARSYWMMSSMTEASRYFGLATDYAHRAGDLDNELRSMEYHAATGMFSGMAADEIHERLTYVYRNAERAGDKIRMASLHNKFGYLVVAQGWGDFDTAEHEYLSGLSLAREIGDLFIEDTLLSNLGILYVQKGDYRCAMEALTKPKTEVQKDTGYWRTFINRYHIGTCWMEMGCLLQAQQALTEACAQLHRLGNYHFESKARCDLGLVHYLAGEYELARRESHDVLELVEAHGDLRFEALVRTRLGYVYEALGQLEDARDSYKRGNELHSQMEQHYYALNALAGSARVALLSGNPTVALDQVETIWKSIEDKSISATVETAMTLRTCYSVFVDSDDPRQEDVFDMAWSQLTLRADSINEPEFRAKFWSLTPHKFFREVAAEAGLAASLAADKLPH